MFAACNICVVAPNHFSTSALFCEKRKKSATPTEIDSFLGNEDIFMWLRQRRQTFLRNLSLSNQLCFLNWILLGSLLSLYVFPTRVNLLIVPKELEWRKDGFIASKLFSGCSTHSFIAQSEEECTQKPHRGSMASYFKQTTVIFIYFMGGLRILGLGDIEYRLSFAKWRNKI